MDVLQIYLLRGPQCLPRTCDSLCRYMHVCVDAMMWWCELLCVLLQVMYMLVYMYVRWLCAADLCVLFQKESPTFRQSPANGLSSINSSILVRTPTPIKPHRQIYKYSSLLFPSYLPWICVMVFLHVCLSLSWFVCLFRCPFIMGWVGLFLSTFKLGFIWRLKE